LSEDQHLHHMKLSFSGSWFILTWACVWCRRSWDTAGLGCWGSMWWSRLICGGQIHLFKYHSSGTYTC